MPLSNLCGFFRAIHEISVVTLIRTNTSDKLGTELGLSLFSCGPQQNWNSEVQWEVGGVRIVRSVRDHVVSENLVHIKEVLFQPSFRVSGPVMHDCTDHPRDSESSSLCVIPVLSDSDFRKILFIVLPHFFSPLSSALLTALTQSHSH